MRAVFYAVSQSVGNNSNSFNFVYSAAVYYKLIAHNVVDAALFNTLTLGTVAPSSLID